MSKLVDRPPTYLDQLSPDEKREADNLARRWLTENGDFITTELLRVMRVLADCKAPIHRSKRRVLRAYIDSLYEVKWELHK